MYSIHPLFAVFWSFIAKNHEDFVSLLNTSSLSLILPYLANITETDHPWTASAVEAVQRLLAAVHGWLQKLPMGSHLCTGSPWVKSVRSHGHLLILPMGSVPIAHWWCCCRPWVISLHDIYTVTTHSKQYTVALWQYRNSFQSTDSDGATSWHWCCFSARTLSICSGWTWALPWWPWWTKLHCWMWQPMLSTTRVDRSADNRSTHRHWSAAPPMTAIIMQAASEIPSFLVKTLQHDFGWLGWRRVIHLGPRDPGDHVGLVFLWLHPSAAT